MSYKTAIIIGAGAFGTSMASVLSHNFSKVVLKVRSQDIYDSLKKNLNEVYLPNLKLEENIIPALTWEELNELAPIDEVDLIVNGLPTSALDSFYCANEKNIKAYLDKETPLVSLSKGIDPETLQLPDDILLNHFAHYKHLFTYLSGPSFAKEIVQKQVTIVSLAGQDPQVLMKIGDMLQTSFFKAIPTYDVKGVLLGGALKNILAIAGGILEGLGFNHNTRAAMITRGITEMLRFGKVFNARPETFYSFAGMGDLILTTTGSLSRNKQFGLELAKGRKAKEIIESQRSVVEGYKTAKAAYKLASYHKIKADLFLGIYEILYKDLSPQEALEKMMQKTVQVIE